MAVVRNLMVRIGADLSELKASMAKAQGTIKNFQNGISGIGTKLGVALGASAAISFLTDATKRAIEVESAVGTLNLTLGASSKAFIDWASTSSRSLNMSKAQALSYGNTYATLLKGFSGGNAQTSKMTQDLLKASAVVASRTGRTMEDVMERVRSGLLGNTEAIEDLGINVNVALLKSTSAFKRFAGDKSWEQLDFQTQQLIRYYGILEQAAGTFGTELADNTAGRVQQFTAALDDLKLAIGEGIIPILNDVLPVLTSIADAFKELENWSYQLGYSLGGGKGYAKKYAESMGDASKSALDQSNASKKTAKNLKDSVKAAKQLAGFDEINQFDKEAAKGGTSSASSTTTTKTTTTPKPKQGGNGKGKDMGLGQIGPPLPADMPSTAQRWGKNVGDAVRYVGGGLLDVPSDAAGLLSHAVTDWFDPPVADSGELPAYMKSVSPPSTIPSYAKKPTVSPPSVVPWYAKPNQKPPAVKKPAPKPPAVKAPAVKPPVVKKPAVKKPKLATGGIVDKPTTALIGEAGAELVMPLENTSFVDKMASALGSAVMSAMQMGGPSGQKNQEVTIKLDGATLAKAIAPYTSREASRLGSSLITVR